MKNLHRFILVLSLVMSILIATYVIIISIRQPFRTAERVVINGIVNLPLPRKISNMSVEEAILLRRSIRDYTDEPIKLDHLALILWSAYGITDVRGFRASPSAGATYPLEIYVVIGENGVHIEGGFFLKPGVYKYDVHKHQLSMIKEGDYREKLSKAALGQSWVKEAPLSIVVCAVFERTTRIYGERGRVRYVPMEVGHLGQNVYLISTALGYGTVVVGAFYDDEVQEVIGSSQIEVPMYIIPIGVPETRYVITFEDIWAYIEDKRR